jgi:hypothetical protein
MFFYVITATIASYTHGWTQYVFLMCSMTPTAQLSEKIPRRLRNVDKAWAVSRDDDMYHTPSLKAVRPHVMTKFTS